MKTTLLSLFFICSFHLSAQNLVMNPSFEDPTDSCNFYFHLLPLWYNPDIKDSCSTPDSFMACDSINGQINPKGIPYNFLGCQFPKSGQLYAGIITYHDPPANSYREYLEGQLTTPLQAGINYCVGIHIALARSVKYASGGMGIYFSDTLIKQSFCDHPGTLPFTPQLQASPIPVLDTLNWKRLQWNYTAHGGEQFLIIGNFNNDATTQKQLNTNLVWPPPRFNAGNTPPLPFAYYYIDDVSVEPDCHVSVTNQAEFDHPNVLIYPMPIQKQSIIEIQSDVLYDKVQLNIYDLYGQQVKIIEDILTNNRLMFDRAGLKAGVYYYQVVSRKQIIGNGKLPIIGD